MIGVFVLVNVVVIVGVLLLKGTDEGADAGGPKRLAPQRVPQAGRVVVNDTIGASIRAPIGWGVEGRDRAIVLRSPDSTTIMSIAEPPGGGSSGELLGSAVGAVQQRYRDVTARPLHGQVAGLPTVSRVLSATNRRGVRLNVLVSSPQGRGRAWLVQVFSGPGARARRLPEAQVALGTLRLGR